MADISVFTVAFSIITAIMLFVTYLLFIKHRNKKYK